MTTDRVGKVLEKVAATCAEHAGRLRMQQKPEPNFTAILEQQIGPLLRAGQAMRQKMVIAAPMNKSSYDWDDALATLEGRDVLGAAIDKLNEDVDS